MKKIIILEEKKSVTRPLVHLLELLNITPVVYRYWHRSMFLLPRDEVGAILVDGELSHLRINELVMRFNPLLMVENILEVPVALLLPREISGDVLSIPHVAILRTPIRLDEFYDLLETYLQPAVLLKNEALGEHSLEPFDNFISEYNVWLSNLRMLMERNMKRWLP